MAEYKLLMPKMGESVIEATILTWHKQVGDVINEHDVVLEVATDKVDTEVPSSVSGVLKQILHEKDAVVPVGDVLAIIEVGGDSTTTEPPKIEEKKEAIVKTKTEVAESKTETKEEVKIIEKPLEQTISEPVKAIEKTVEVAKQIVQPTPTTTTHHSNRYYSPLVLNIAQVENISMQELESIKGNGVDNRVTKEDILEYVEQKKKGLVVAPKPTVETSEKKTEQKAEVKQEQKVESKAVEKTQDSKLTTQDSNIEIIEMDRMRKLISQHMTSSVKTSAHVSSFVECDVTNIVRWRDKHKNAFQKREGFSLSFMPIFVEAITKAIKDFPMINVSVDGDKIIKKKDINIGIATALPSGNLIVPVVKQADQKSLLGIAKAMNNIVQKARTNTLQSDDVMDGTYTISNIGTFGNIIGTPIINQPQVAIMAVGSITKKPVVIEVDGQDVIAIRHMMYLSHTYDHRVVDGMLGGMFVKKVADYLEKFDLHQEI
ncbi:MAG: dihydrolipoamide acetyltransferase family protein [Chitinophagales bacterium]